MEQLGEQSEPQSPFDLDEQIRIEQGSRRRRDEAMEREYLEAAAERGEKPPLNEGAYDPERPERDPEADPTTPEAWRRMVERPELIAEKGGGGKGRSRRDKAKVTAEALRERQRQALGEDDSRGPGRPLKGDRPRIRASVSIDATTKRVFAEAGEPMGAFLDLGAMCLRHGVSVDRVREMIDRLNGDGQMQETA